MGFLLVLGFVVGFVAIALLLLFTLIGVLEGLERRGYNLDPTDRIQGYIDFIAEKVGGR